MSRTLKRPMFRKGGEVMEGIMTGIKPRKMFSTGTLSAADQEIVGDVERKMRLINAVGGGSALSDPLTQFLLTAGGIKPGLDRAVKTQQLKDLSNRKLATALISKSKVSDTRKLYNALKNRKNPKTGKLFTLEDVAGDKAMAELYRKETSETEKIYKKGLKTEDDLGKYKDFLRNPKYNPLEKKRVANAIKEINANEKLEEEIDVSNPFISKDDYEKGSNMKTPEGEIRRVFIPNDKDDFQPQKKYFIVEANAFFFYDAQNNKLIEAK